MDSTDIDIEEIERLREYKHTLVMVLERLLDIDDMHKDSVLKMLKQIRNKEHIT